MQFTLRNLKIAKLMIKLIKNYKKENLKKEKENIKKIKRKRKKKRKKKRKTSWCENKKWKCTT